MGLTISQHPRSDPSGHAAKTTRDQIATRQLKRKQKDSKAIDINDHHVSDSLESLRSRDLQKEYNQLWELHLSFATSDFWPSFWCLSKFDKKCWCLREAAPISPAWPLLPRRSRPSHLATRQSQNIGSIGKSVEKSRFNKFPTGSLQVSYRFPIQVPDRSPTLHNWFLSFDLSSTFLYILCLLLFLTFFCCTSRPPCPCFQACTKVMTRGLCPSPESFFQLSFLVRIGVIVSLAFKSKYRPSLSSINQPPKELSLKQWLGCISKRIDQISLLKILNARLHTSACPV